MTQRAFQNSSGCSKKMTQKSIIVLHLFGQYDSSRQSFMPPVCEEAAAMGSSQHPILTWPVPPYFHLTACSRFLHWLFLTVRLWLILLLAMEAYLSI